MTLIPTLDPSLACVLYAAENRKQTALEKRVQSQTTSIQTFEEAIAQYGNHSNLLSIRMDHFETKFDEINHLYSSRIQALENALLAKMQVIESSTANRFNKLVTVATIKKEIIGDVETRISKKIDAISKRITSLEKKLDKDTDTINKSLAVIETQIDGIHKRLHSQSDYIQAVHALYKHK